MGMFVTYVVGFDQADRDNVIYGVLKTDVCVYDVDTFKVLDEENSKNIVKVVVNSEVGDFKEIYSRLFSVLKNPMRTKIYSMSRFGIIQDSVCFIDLQLKLKVLDEEAVRKVWWAGSGFLMEKIEKEGL